MLQQDQLLHQTTDSNTSQDAALMQKQGGASNPWAAKALKGSIYSWFVLAMIGRWLFALYIAVRYGGPVVSGNYSAVNQGLSVGGIRKARQLKTGFISPIFCPR